MVTEKINYVTIGALLCVLVFIQAKCTKTPFDCANTAYSFLLPVRAYPDKDSINIGDTIWLEINESTTFTNGQANQVVDYSGAVNLGTALSFGRYDPNENSWPNEHPDNFKLVLPEGLGRETGRTNIDVRFLFSEKQNRYRFLLGVVPKRQGLFSLVFSDSNNTYRKHDK